MRSPPTFPRITGSTRLTHALIGSVAIIGIAASIGALSGSQISFPFIGNVPALKLGGALVIMLVALLFAATELQRRSAAKLALFPALLCAFWVFQNLFHWNSFLPNAFASQIPGAPTYQGPYMAIVTSLGLLLSCLTLAWSGLRRAQRARLTCEAVIGSLLIAVGLSTFLDHVARLTAIYAWGSQHPMAPVAAIALILIGAIHLLRSWRETYRRTRSSPAWLPLFPVIICLTLSLVLSMGLQKRENVYLSSRTSATLDKLAVTIGRQMDLQAKAVEAFAARWDAEPSRTETIWQALSSKFIADGNRIGVVAISYLDNNYHRRWFHPAGDAPALAFPSQTEDPARRAALREAAQNLEEKSGLPTAVLSNTTIVSGQTSGFVIYMPDLRQGVLQGYLAVEYDYTQFFRTIINTQLNLEQDFNTSLSISGKVFLGALANVLPTSENLTLTSTYPVYGRRINISLTPTEEYLDRRRRQLPELTLLAGIGITFFLGLSIHLARVARHRQHQAERSNQRLLAENEERRRIENRLKISDERLRQALDTTQIGIFENNTVSKRVYYSPGLWSMLGYDHRQMQATIDIWESLIHPEDRATYNAAKHCQLRGRTAFIDPEYRVRGRTGAWHWIYSRLRVVSSANGLPTRILGTLQDVTARREAELSLRSSQAETRKLSLVAAKTDTPVIIGSPDAKIEWVNESFTRIMGYGLAVASGRELPDLLIGPETDPQMLAKIREAITQGIPCQVDLASYSQNGQRYYLRIEIQPVRHTSGRLENYIGILADMTARVETETQLRLAKASAEEAVRIKSEFLASMSHEIRTPMNGVIGMTNLLKETELNAEQREFVNTIHRSGEALLTIINDILDFSKIESGNLNLESLPVDLASCIEDSSISLRSRPPRKTWS